MKVISVLVLCVTILLVGFSEVIKEKSVSKALGEIIRFVNFYDSQLNYRKPDFNALCEQCRNMDFQYISFDCGEILLHKTGSKELCCVFSEFTGQIGTTDIYGQTLLCKEYLKRFGDMLSERKHSENSKIKVNIAVSILCAVGVFVTFI